MKIILLWRGIEPNTIIIDNAGALFVKEVSG